MFYFMSIHSKVILDTHARARTHTPYVLCTLMSPSVSQTEHMLYNTTGDILYLSVNLSIIMMYIYHALINALSAHMIHISLNMIFYTHVKHSPTKTVYIKYY